mmetsp:Transcript_19778/g.27462  ORF Transcript_19778/g.27462 Transcript_19778/m.27462 type:complete len:100 (+) Transcript_19778:171-470(+)
MLHGALPAVVENSQHGVSIFQMSEQDFNLHNKKEQKKTWKKTARKDSDAPQANRTVIVVPVRLAVPPASRRHEQKRTLCEEAGVEFQLVSESESIGGTP